MKFKPVFLAALKEAYDDFGKAKFSEPPKVSVGTKIFLTPQEKNLISKSLQGKEDLLGDVPNLLNKLNSANFSFDNLDPNEREFFGDLASSSMWGASVKDKFSQWHNQRYKKHNDDAFYMK